MDRIDTPGSVSGEFRQGNPFADPQIPSTIVGAVWLNGVQEELLYLIEQAGITPDKLDSTQVRAAILAEITAAIQSGGGLVDTFASAPKAGSAGDPVLVVDTFGIAQADFTLGNPVTLALTGVYTLDKKAGVGEALSQGGAAFWRDGGADWIQNDPGVAHLVGYATEDAADGATEVEVRLNGMTRDTV